MTGGCFCKKCLAETARTARARHYAPRLARAMDQWYAARVLARRRVLAEIDGRRRRHAARLERAAHLEWLVSHRELQLVRAYATGSAKYIRQRTRLLALARAEQAEFELRTTNNMTTATGEAHA